MGQVINLKRVVIFWFIVLCGVIVHTAFWLSKTGMHYPDEIFQYIEPALIKLKGFGWLPWEFGRGVRNWTLIAFYGGLMKIFLSAGADGSLLHKLISLHNTLLAIAIFPATWTIAKIYGGERAGLASAFLSSVLPPIVFFTPHPLSEVPSMVLSTWGLMFWLDGRKMQDGRIKAFKSGILLGLSVVVRFYSIVFVVVPLIDYTINFFKHKQKFFYFIAGGTVSLLVLGISDWITWGKPFHSAIEYFRYNILEWGNADHGVSPWWQYFSWFYERINYGLIVFLPLLLLGAIRAKLLTATALVVMIPLCLISHKEERFILGLWPILISIFSIGISMANSRICSLLKSLHAGWEKIRIVDPLAGAVFCAVVLVSTAIGTSRLQWHWLGNLFEAQEFVGKQPDVTGCMFEGRLHLSGGSTYINRNIPMDSYQSILLHNPLFNYFILSSNSIEAKMARQKGWIEKANFDDIIVFQRK